MAAWSGSLFHFFHYFHFIHYKGIKPCSWNWGSMTNFLKLAKKNTTRTKLQIIFSDNQSAWKRWDWNRNKLLYEHINKPGTENWVDVNITLMSLKPDLRTIRLSSTLGHWFIILFSAFTVVRPFIPGNEPPSDQRTLPPSLSNQIPLFQWWCRWFLCPNKTPSAPWTNTNDPWHNT